MLKKKAHEIINILQDIAEVEKCTLYGSLVTDTYDELSDIDIEVDVSGYDNGQFMLSIADILKDKMSIYYCDYAPSFVPEKYIVSLGIDEENPFLVLDLCCCAEPHCTTVTKQQVMAENDKFTHTLKVWTANLKHYVRGDECYDDIVRMARRLDIEEFETLEGVELLEAALCWMEDNVTDELEGFIASCRRMFEELLELFFLTMLYTCDYNYYNFIFK